MSCEANSKNIFAHTGASSGEKLSAADSDWRAVDKSGGGCEWKRDIHVGVFLLWNLCSMKETKSKIKIKQNEAVKIFFGENL